MYEPDDNEEAINSIPLENLGDSGLIVHRYEPWKEGDPTKPNNVLIGCIDRLQTLALVGIDKDTGEFYFASSIDDVDAVQAMLYEFSKVLNEYEKGE